MEGKKQSFFKKVRTSIFDFEGYKDLAAEKVSRTIGYIALIILIFGIVISCAYTFQFLQIINEVKNYIDTAISEVSYENYELSIKLESGEKIAEIDPNNLLANKVIINTLDDQDKINESIEKIKKEENAILILKDKIVVKVGFWPDTTEYSYKTISEKYNINNISKSELINILSSNQMKTFIFTFFVAMVIYMFVLYFPSVLLDVLLLAVLAYIVTKLSRLRLKYSAIYNIAAYSLTLPILLNIIYMTVNIFTGFTIKYFQIMYTAIASIYIITAILIIKSDVIKQQIELNKIIEEQEKVKQELKQKEEEKKEQEELEKRKEKKKTKDKEERKSEEENNGKEPEGNNA